MERIECPCGYIFDENVEYQECCVGGHIPSCLKCPKCNQWLERRKAHFRLEPIKPCLRCGDTDCDC